MKNLKDYVQAFESVVEDSFRNFEDNLKTDTPVFITKTNKLKPSDVKTVLQHLKYTLITIDCKKANAEELSMNMVDGEKVLPTWAQLVDDYKDKNFAVCLYDLDQAKPEITNAVMPLVLDRKIDNVKLNCYVFAVGTDFDKLSKPLQSRFK